MAVINLTEAKIRTLPLGSGIHRDEQVKGLMVICHRTTKTYAAQSADKPLELFEIERREPLENEVMIEIEYCGL